MSKLFISYRRDDSADATGRIYDRLVARYGADNIFKDAESIPPGVDFRTHLMNAVGRCEALLAIIGKQWLTVTDDAGLRRLDDERDFVRIEIESALQRKIAVIPVLVGGATMPRSADLPASLQDLAFRQGVPVRRDPDFHPDVDRLIASLDRLIAVREITNSIGMKFVRIPAGTFAMGSPESEPKRDPDEGPVHKVDITKPFYFGLYPVTQGEYERVMGTNPSHFCPTGKGAKAATGPGTPRLPVENVSWFDAVEFCRRLAELPEERRWNRTYRLPTEAEWEYACRGGASGHTAFHFGDSASSSQANFDGNSPYGGAARGPFMKRTAAVGWYQPNAYGLFDMHGNVWEWCQDWYDPEYYKRSPERDPQGPETSPANRRVLRGGSWDLVSWYCRTTARGGYDPGEGTVGFRVVLNSATG